MRRSMRSYSGCLPNLVIEQRGSRRVLAFISCAVFLGLVTIALSPMSWWQQGLAACLVLGSGGRELRRSWPGARGYLCELQLAGDGYLRCAFVGDQTGLVSATVIHGWTVFDRVAGIRVDRDDGHRVQAIFFSDQLRPDQWRRLRASLRLSGA